MPPPRWNSTARSANRAVSRAAASRQLSNGCPDAAGLRAGQRRGHAPGGRGGAVACPAPLGLRQPAHRPAGHDRRRQYWICKRGPQHAYEAFECLGGNGFTEDFPLAMCYREQPVMAVWEGSGHVIALDLLRARGGTGQASRRSAPRWALPPGRADLRCALGPEAEAARGRGRSRHRHRRGPAPWWRTWPMPCRHRCSCSMHPQPWRRPSSPPDSARTGAAVRCVPGRPGPVRHPGPALTRRRGYRAAGTPCRDSAS